MSPIRFKAKLYKIGTWTLLRLPESASAKLPSRALTIIEGNINGIGFKAALEPDGKGSHWFKLDETLQKDAHAKSGDTVSLSIQLTNEWIEPEVPADFKKALSTSPKANALWKDITPNARWDWIRWIRAVKSILK